MTPALYTITLLAGLTLGWQTCLLAAGRRQAEVVGRRADRPRAAAGAAPAAPTVRQRRPGGHPSEIDLRDTVAGGTPTANPPGPPATAIYDWRTDPVIASCHACHGKGRIWLIDGRGTGHGYRCPCGTPVTRTRTAAR